jgi:hypothetical protein
VKAGRGRYGKVEYGGNDRGSLHGVVKIQSDPPVHRLCIYIGQSSGQTSSYPPALASMKEGDSGGEDWN